MAGQDAVERRRLNDLGSDVLITIATFTELADIASFALTSRHFASALKKAEHSIGPALAAKYAPAVLALHPILPNPKHSLFTLFKRHMRAKAASTAPQPARVPRSSLADYYFSYELCSVAGWIKAAWAGLAHFIRPGEPGIAIIEMPLGATVVERIIDERGRNEREEDNENTFSSDLQLTIYITKISTTEVVKIYDGVLIEDYRLPLDSLYFTYFEFAPCLWYQLDRVLNMVTVVNFGRDASTLTLWVQVDRDDSFTGYRTQAEFLVELEQGFVFSRCL
jgi:hypothetical protein